jgi:two-component system, NarL family, sensor kinase
MARRLQRGHRERETLLANAVDASAQERRRRATSPASPSASHRWPPRARGAAIRPRPARCGRSPARCATRCARCARGSSRCTAPATRESAGLHVALSDPRSPLQADGERRRWRSRATRRQHRRTRRRTRLPGGARGDAHGRTGAIQRARRGQAPAAGCDAARRRRRRRGLRSAAARRSRDAGPPWAGAAGGDRRVGRRNARVRSAPGAGTIVEMELSAR